MINRFNKTMLSFYTRTLLNHQFCTKHGCVIIEREIIWHRAMYRVIDGVIARGNVPAARKNFCRIWPVRHNNNNDDNDNDNDNNNNNNNFESTCTI